MSNDEKKARKESFSLSQCLKSLALFFKSIPTFFLNLISPAKLQTSQIKLNRSHTKSHNTFLTLFVGAGSFLIAFIFGSFLLIPSDSNAEDATTLANDASLSIALSPSNLDLNLTPTPSGTLSAAELGITINTTNSTGYTLSLASGNSTSTALTNTNSNITENNTINSTTATIDSPSPLTSNTWGWYPNSLVNNPGYNNSNPANSNYQLIAIPNSSDPYIIKQTNTATSDSGDLNTITIATKVDTTLPAGTYTNTLTISAVTNYVPQPILDVYPTTGWAGDTITLYSNGGFVDVQSVTIGGANCTSIDVKSADELTCTLPDKAETDTTSGTDNGYSISVTASNTSLDAHNFTIRYFNPDRTETASGSNTQITNTNMSSFTGVDCGSLSVGDIVSLTDERNGQSYRIKKMEDNKCWMVDNMKYKGEGITISNIGDGTTGITYNNTPNRLNTVDGTASEAVSGVGTNYDKAFYNDPALNTFCHDDTYSGSYTKCGYLYNWYAATAGSGTYGTSSGEVLGSICPIGWRLPTAIDKDGSSINTDLAILNASMNAGYLVPGSVSSNFYEGWQFTGDWLGTFSGFWNGHLYGQSMSGYYWSSAASSLQYAWSLSFGDSSVNPGTANNVKLVGFAVRCVHSSVITVSFDGNGADNGSMDTQLIAVGDTQNLLGNTYTRTGHEFIGWNTAADGSGVPYGDGASYSAPVNPDSYTITLYAQWEEEITYIQDFTLTECQSKASDTNFTVVDKRDGNDYTVRYINGNCWMTQNLRIAGGTTLDSSTSNIVSIYTLPSDSTDFTSYLTPVVHYSGDISLGSWYNFCAVSAGTVCSSNLSQKATQDICPVGWHLPTYTELISIAPYRDYSQTYAATFSGVTSAYYYSVGWDSDYGGGGWWSSDADSYNTHYLLLYYPSHGLMTTNANRSYGWSVRCIRSN